MFNQCMKITWWRCRSIFHLAALISLHTSLVSPFLCLISLVFLSLCSSDKKFRKSCCVPIVNAVKAEIEQWKLWSFQITATKGGSGVWKSKPLSMVEIKCHCHKLLSIVSLDFWVLSKLVGKVLCKYILNILQKTLKFCRMINSKKSLLRLIRLTPNIKNNDFKNKRL